MKPTCADVVNEAIESPPARGRGLKHKQEPEALGLDASPPARGRGLKQARAGGQARRVRVAPRAGAWIETLSLATRLGT